jgi:hypothetical protein
MFASTFWPRFLTADMVGELSHVDPFQRAKMCHKMCQNVPKIYEPLQILSPTSLLLCIDLYRFVRFDLEKP